MPTLTPIRMRTPTRMQTRMRTRIKTMIRTKTTTKVTTRMEEATVKTRRLKEEVIFVDDESFRQLKEVG